MEDFYENTIHTTTLPIPTQIMSYGNSVTTSSDIEALEKLIRRKPRTLQNRHARFGEIQPIQRC